MRRWLHRWLAIVLAATMLLCAATVLLRQYFVVMPGSTYDVAEMVVVRESASREPGRILMTTVRTRRADLLWCLRALVDPEVEMVPERDFLPQGMTWEAYQERNRLMMLNSQATALVVALETLGHPVRLERHGVVVLQVVDGSPAQGRLRAGDVIVGIGNAQVLSREELGEAITSYSPGDRVIVTVLRDHAQVEVAIPTAEHPDRPGVPFLGVMVYDAPYSVEGAPGVRVKPTDIGGPSAALPLALEIFRRFTLWPDMEPGDVVAATGVLAPDGTISRVGGLEHKVRAAERAGADVFLVPEDNAGEIQDPQGGMRVVAVSTFQEALRVLGWLRQR